MVHTRVLYCTVQAFCFSVKATPAQSPTLALPIPGQVYSQDSTSLLGLHRQSVDGVTTMAGRLPEGFGRVAGTRSIPACARCRKNFYALKLLPGRARLACRRPETAPAGAGQVASRFQHLPPSGGHHKDMGLAETFQEARGVRARSEMIVRFAPARDG
jgi:hypothetical protein